MAKSKINKLAEETGEIADLMIEEDGYGIYPYISKGDQVLNLDTHVGTR